MVKVAPVALVLTAAFGLVRPAMPGTNRHDAQYLGGTLSDIDERTNGTLDFSDEKCLEFNYGSSHLKLPYASIRNFQFSTLKERKTLAYLHIPKNPLQNRNHVEVVAISFRKEDGEVGTASFRVGGLSRSLLESELNKKMEAQRKAATENEGKVKPPETWWGDRYWRTARNKAKWPDQSADSTSIPAGTK